VAFLQSGSMAKFAELRDFSQFFGKCSEIRLHSLGALSGGRVAVDLGMSAIHVADASFMDVIDECHPV
jgi:hypothetical protein